MEGQLIEIIQDQNHPRIHFVTPQKASLNFSTNKIRFSGVRAHQSETTEMPFSHSRTKFSSLCCCSKMGWGTPRGVSETSLQGGVQYELHNSEKGW